MVFTNPHVQYRSVCCKAPQTIYWSCSLSKYYILFIIIIYCASYLCQLTKILTNVDQEIMIKFSCPYVKSRHFFILFIFAIKKDTKKLQLSVKKKQKKEIVKEPNTQVNVNHVNTNITGVCATFNVYRWKY